MSAPLRVAIRDSHKTGEYVTHVQNMQTLGYSWGHYFTSYSEAMGDYLTRCAHYGVNPDSNA